MFWRKKKTPEDERREKAKKAVKKIEGPLWGYMVTQRGVVVDVLQHLRRVEVLARLEVSRQPWCVFSTLRPLRRREWWLIATKALTPPND